MSLVAVDEFLPTVAFQEDTTVVRAHRGHRLGLLMKTDMLRWVADAAARGVRDRHLERHRQPPHDRRQRTARLPGDRAAGRATAACCDACPPFPRPRPRVTGDMSSNRRVLAATPDQVWEILSDGWLYPLWVVGASRMREVDDHWPDVGARLHHSVGTLAAAGRRHHRGAGRDAGLDAPAAGQDLADGRGRGDPAPVAGRDGHRGDDRGAGHLGAGRPGAQAGPGSRRWAGGTSSPCAAWRTSPSGVRDPRRRRRRRRAERPGRRQPARRPRLVGAGARGPARRRRRGAQRRGRAPGFVHDTFSAFYPLAAASPTIRSLRPRGARSALAARAGGARPPTARRRLGAAPPRPRGHGGRARRAPRRATARRGWSSCADWDRIGEHLIRGLLTPFPPVRAGLGAAGPAPERRRAGLRADPADARPSTSPAAASAASGRGCCWPGNAGHADIPLDAPGSGLMALLMTHARPDRRLPRARGRRRRADPGDGPAPRPALGGEIRCSAEVVADRGDAAAGRPACAPRTASATGRRAPWSPTSSRRSCTAGCSAPDDVPAAGGARDAPLPAGPRDGQGRLGAGRAGPVGLAAGPRTRARSTSPTRSRRWPRPPRRWRRASCRRSRSC